jgi:hypothetical protein
MHLSLLLARSLSLSFDDVAIGVLSGKECLLTRVLPMSRTWYQLVPEVNVYSDALPDLIWPNFEGNNRSNVFFHQTGAFGHVNEGSLAQSEWNRAQSRHLPALLDLYSRYPTKKFYFFCDDDTFVNPTNLLSALGNLNSSDELMYGRVYNVPDFVKAFFVREGIQFNHGGSGVVITAALMARLAPLLSDCNNAFEIHNVASDIRLALCIDHFLQDLSKPQRHLTGINSGHPGEDFLFMNPGPQLSFHFITDNLTFRLFDTLVTVVDNDTYIDWGSLAFQPVIVPAGNPHRYVYFVFGYVFCIDNDNSFCARAEAGIKRTTNTIANFSQKYSRGTSVYYRCNDRLADGEIVHFADAQPPTAGIVLEIKCPGQKKFVARGNGQRRFTIDPDDIL